ncbi:MAG: hypothetical protein RQ733_13840, partial [Methyloprofundus sp.]|nr:hypothetical protein [Methyloprofundus sp.]
MKLNVFIHGEKVGELFERAGANVDPDIVFKYDAGVSKENFAFIYDGGDIYMSPAYDLVCTHAYVIDPPALALEEANYSKLWWSRDDLLAFADRHCYITKKQGNKIINEMGSTIAEQGMALISRYSDKCKRQLNPPNQTTPFTLKAEFFRSPPR